MDGKFRTSIIVDPPNGRMPEMTEAAKAKRAARDKLRGPNDGSAWWLDIDGPDGREGREYRRRQRRLAALCRGLRDRWRHRPSSPGDGGGAAAKRPLRSLASSAA